MQHKQEVILDIGRKSVKVLLMKKVGRDNHVVDFDIFETPEGLINTDDYIQILPEFSARLKESMRKMNVKTRNMSVTIPNAGVIVREVTLPVVDESKLRSMIDMEIPQHFLLNLKDYVIDYKILGKTSAKDGAPQYSILLAAAPKGMIESYLLLAQASGLQISSIDFFGNSLSKLIRKEIVGEGAPSTVVTLDIGEFRTDVTISLNGMLKYTRSVMFGGEDVRRTIIEAGGVSAEVAGDTANEIDMIRFLKSYTGELTEAEKAVGRLVEGFVSEVTRIFDFYSSRDTQNRIDMVYLTGGYCGFKNLEALLSAEFAVKTSLFPEIAKFPVERRAEEFQKQRMLFANALGASLDWTVA